MRFQALILAAGKGIRMRSGRAKVLHCAAGQPLLEHVLKTLQPLGPEPITVVTGHQAELVETAFAGRGLRFVRQEPQRGTGHAVQAARNAIESCVDRPLLILSGDTPLLRPKTVADLITAHGEARATATVLSCRLVEPGSYGRIVRDTSGAVVRIVEAKDAKGEEKLISEINAGVYVFETPALLSVLDRLSDQNAQGELYLTEVLGLLVAAGGRIQALAITDASETLGVNTMKELSEAAQRLHERRLQDLMRSGAIIEDPGSTFVGTEAQVEPDAVLRPFTILEGQTIVRARARIGPFARLVDTTVGEEAVILDHCLLLESAVENGATIGPFAHIRSGYRIGTGSKVKG